MNKRKNEYPLSSIRERTINRITLKSFLKDLSEVLNLESGMLFVIKCLLINPGETVRSYLYESRYKHFHPVRFLLITTAINFFLFWIIDGAENLSNSVDFVAPESFGGDQTEKTQLFRQLFSEIFNDYFNLMIWLFIPVVSFFSYLFYINSDYNYAENLVLNTYITGMANLFSIITYPLIFVTDIRLTSLAANLLSVTFNIYAYHRFFRYPSASVVRAIAALIIGYVVYSIAFSLIIGIIVGIKMAKMDL